MPDPEKILRLLDKAATVCRKTPGRVGRLVNLTGAADVLVAGDLHGNVGHFQSLLKKADLARNQKRHFVLQEVLHGPFQYEDGSDKSHQLLDLVAATIGQFPGRVHFLPGNHEFAQRTDRQIGKASGELNSLFRAGVTFAYGDRSDQIYQTYMNLVDAAPLGLRTPNRVFLSHSLPPADKAWDADALTAPVLPVEAFSPGGSVYNLVWGRDLAEATAIKFLNSVDADLLVTGHIPCPEGFLVPNTRQLVLDSQQPPAGFCVFASDRPITHAELVAGAAII